MRNRKLSHAGHVLARGQTLLLLALWLAAAPRAHATIAFWTGVGGANWSGNGGTQNWSSTVANPGVPYTPVDGDDLRWLGFSTANKESVNDIANLSVGNVSFQGAPSGIVLSGNTLTVTGTVGGGGGRGTINLPLELNAATVVIGDNTGDNITINGGISETGGSRGIRVNAGTVTLAGSNSFSGNVQLAYTTAGPTVNINTLGNIGANQSLGAGSLITFGFRTFDGTVVYSGGETATDKGFAIGENTTASGRSGGGSFVNDGTGAVTWTGPQTRLNQNAAETRTFGLGGSNAGNNTWQSAIQNNNAGLIAFTKSGTGTWILSGANTYEGDTLVSAGVLLINGDQSGALGAVSVDAGAVLGGTGTIGGVSAAVSGTVAPGLADALGTLSFASTAVDFSSDGSLLAQLDAASFTSDLLSLTGTGSLTLGGTSTLDLVGPASFTSAGTYTLATFPSGNRTSEFTTVKYNGTTYASPTTTGGINSGGTLVYNADSIQLVVVPEPGTLALAGLGMCLAGILARGRRRKSGTGADLHAPAQG